MTDVLVNHVHYGGRSGARTRKPSTSASLTTLKAASRSTPAITNHTDDGPLGALSRALRHVNALVLSLRDGLTHQEREHLRKVEERRQILCLRMQNAETRKQWQDAAEELDDLEENEEWKADPTTADYNPDLIEARLKDLDEARTNCDIRAMMYLVRTALSRDLGGMGNTDLYRHAYVGTKDLIERYVDSALQTIDALVEKSQYALPVGGISHRDILESVLFARQSFGRSALLLSGGGTFGMSHIGVLKALFEVNLLPRIISGASAGSIVCAVMCTRTDEEIPHVISHFPYGDLNVFDDNDKPDGVFDHLRRLLTEGSWSDIQNLTRVMRTLLGDITFQEAYNRTRRILNICVSTESIYELPRLLNYVTAPNVMIWSAVAASCSVPFVFTAAALLVKVPDTGEHRPWNPTPQRWIDGSVDNDLPMTRLAELFNVNHFIVSQVNPHVVPFLGKDDQLNPVTYHVRKAQPISSKQDSDWVYTVTALAKDEAMHRLHFLAEMGVFPNLVTKLRSVLSQKYSGDINIFPVLNMNDLPRLLSNPTSEFMQRACLAGERATWPKLSRVRDRCAIELGLDGAVHRLRARVVFSDSQVDLRRLATGIAPAPPSSSPPPLHHDLSRRPLRHHEAHTGPPHPHPHPGGSHTLPIDVGEAPSKTHQRRSSGSSIQLMAHHRRLMLENVLTDEETEEEERLEMRVRHGQGGTSPVLVRKPRLKRSAKSQNHFSTDALLRGQHQGTLLSVSTAAPTDQASTPRPDIMAKTTSSTSFDFGKAPPPPPSSATAPTASAAVQRRLGSPPGTISPTDEMETSEMHSYSSEGGFDSRTDETVSDMVPTFDGGGGGWLYDGSAGEGRGNTLAPRGLKDAAVSERRQASSLGAMGEEKAPPEGEGLWN